MAQFEAFNKDVEVNKQTVLSVVNSMEKGQDKRMAILNKHNIDPEKNDWFLQQDWLDAFKDIANSLGDMNLFLIGKAIIDHAQFPPLENLKEALHSIDVAYHMNHRLNGKMMFDENTGKMSEGIGHYKVTEFDEEGHKATMVCNNPYPSKFDEGIITQVVRRFKPSGARESVELDTSKESRVNGADSCTYNISW